MEATSPSTSVSLVRHVQHGDAVAWDRFASLYVPLVYHWAREGGLQESDAQDVSQNVFLTVVKKISQFQHQGQTSSLRGWLYAITRRAVIDLYRKQQRQVPSLEAEQLAGEEISAEASAVVPKSEQALLILRAAEIVRQEMSQSAWEMFEQLTLQGRSAEQIAAERGVSVWAVYKARSRVLARCRELLSDFLTPEA